MRENIVAEIKQRLPIEQYIQKYIPLKRNGSRWVGLCPFHQEKSPSFYVNAHSGFFYCFGCHVHGDLFSFAERYHGMEFKDVLHSFIEELGITTQGYKYSKGTQSSSKQQLFTMYTLAATHFTNNLHANTAKQHLDYFKERGLSLETIQSFQLGYSLPSWDSLVTLLRRSGFSKETIASSGLVHSKGDHLYDAFRDRYIFPIITTGGSIIAFGGRIQPSAENGQAKYINSPETPIYTKGKELYGLAQARKHITVQKTIMITEGYFDVLTLHQHGYNNAVAVLGTSLTKEHARNISSFASTVELVFDADNAGQKATLSATKLLLAEGIRVQILTLPQGEDIDSFLRSFGKQAFEERRALAKEGLTFCIEYVQSLAPKEISAWICDFIKEIHDPMLLAQYTKKLAFGFGIPEQSIYASAVQLEELLQESNSTIPIHHSLTEKEYAILKHLITYPHNINIIQNAGLDFVLYSQESKAITQALYTQRADYDSMCEVLSIEEQAILAQLFIDIEPSDKEEYELRDILAYLEKEYLQRNTASATMLITDTNDIEGLSRIQKIIHSRVANTE